MRPDRGVALLEILAAIVILTIAGLSLVALVAGGIRAASVARDREREQGDEDRLLAAYSLLTRGDLDIRIGSREIGPYLVAIARPETALYRIALSRAAAPEVEELVTVVYRPASP